MSLDRSAKLAKGPSPHLEAAETTQEYSAKAESPALLGAPDPHASDPKYFLLRHQSFLLHLLPTCCPAVACDLPCPSKFFLPQLTKGPSFFPSSASFAGVLSNVLCCPYNASSCPLPKGSWLPPPPHPGPQTHITRTPREPDPH